MQFIGAKNIFPPDSFSWLASVENGHFWFEQRNELILWAIRHFSGAPKHYLEVGCGTGFCLSRIARAFPEAKLCAVEYYPEAITIAQKRSPQARISRADALDFNTDELFDAVGCFDVLEHVPDDKALLKKMQKMLFPKGRLFVSVPQHPWLWSNEDTMACHQRRYTCRGLLRLAETCGLKCIWHSSFVCSLAPLMLWRRFRPKPKSAVAGLATLEFSLPKPVNWIFGRLLAAERSVISTGVSLPFGGSLLMVLEKESPQKTFFEESSC